MRVRMIVHPNCSTGCMALIYYFFMLQVLCTNLNRLKLGNINLEMGIFDNGLPIKTLVVESCHGLRNIFSLPMFKGLTRLRTLELIDCQQLQEVIAREEDLEGQTNIKETRFPQLKELKLSKLPKMYRFCHMTNDLDFPSLDKITIEDCPIMESFSLGSLHFPSYTRVYGIQDPIFATKFFFNKEV